MHESSSVILKFQSFYIKKERTLSLFFKMYQQLEDYPELRGVGPGGRDDLPPTRLELVGDRAVPGQRHVVAGGHRGPELEHRHVQRTPHLNCPVQPGDLLRRCRRFRAAGDPRVALRHRWRWRRRPALSLPPGEQPHGSCEREAEMARLRVLDGPSKVREEDKKAPTRTGNVFGKPCMSCITRVLSHQRIRLGSWDLK